MICPKCEAEYVEGVTVCADCNTELVTVEEFEHHLIHHDDWTPIFQTSLSYEADMIKANLEGAEIESIVLSQNDKNFPATGDLTVIKVLVKKNDEEDAKQIISDINTEQ
ncbi:MAG: DUF2007 domain-containing protein [Ignavibacteriae bacterium]|nr:DUF2007 domain-containing protein [Ignavibacteriota bacterium]MCB0751223.1 DUF2007 domain-containing protein [Ignavibacteriota bacterium]MCB9207211.1 DUF2007 domain-containing protein [Ignavibacteriales bacterium]MCB9219106.1 DUF2007 domain-containing protein [Ignavibacteriales bacterium]MCB9259688.1 DUF2007 domain-containing protein [Ignavibacteriales bacterium]